MDYSFSDMSPPLSPVTYSIVRGQLRATMAQFDPQWTWERPLFVYFEQ